MKSFLIVMLFLSANVFAQDLSRVDADLRCETKNGGVALKYGTDSTAKAWFTNPGEELGLKLDLKSFEIGACVGCLTYTAELFGAPLRGIVKNFVLTQEAYNFDTNRWEVVYKNVKCKEVN